MSENTSIIFTENVNDTDNLIAGEIGINNIAGDEYLAVKSADGSNKATFKNTSTLYDNLNTISNEVKNAYDLNTRVTAVETALNNNTNLLDSSNDSGTITIKGGTTFEKPTEFKDNVNVDGDVKIKGAKIDNLECDYLGCDNFHVNSISAKDNDVISVDCSIDFEGVTQFDGDVDFESENVGFCNGFISNGQCTFNKGIYTADDSTFDAFVDFESPTEFNDTVNFNNEVTLNGNFYINKEDATPAVMIESGSTNFNETVYFNDYVGFRDSEGNDIAEINGINRDVNVLSPATFNNNITVKDSNNKDFIGINPTNKVFRIKDGENKDIFIVDAVHDTVKIKDNVDNKDFLTVDTKNKTVNITDFVNINPKNRVFKINQPYNSESLIIDTKQGFIQLWNKSGSGYGSAFKIDTNSGNTEFYDTLTFKHSNKNEGYIVFDNDFYNPSATFNVPTYFNESVSFAGFSGMGEFDMNGKVIISDEDGNGKAIFDTANDKIIINSPTEFNDGTTLSKGVIFADGDITFGCEYGCNIYIKDSGNGRNLYWIGEADQETIISTTEQDKDMIYICHSPEYAESVNGKVEIYSLTSFRGHKHSQFLDIDPTTETTTFTNGTTKWVSKDDNGSKDMQLLTIDTSNEVTTFGSDVIFTDGGIDGAELLGIYTGSSNLFIGTETIDVCGDIVCNDGATIKFGYKNDNNKQVNIVDINASWTKFYEQYTEDENGELSPMFEINTVENEVCFTDTDIWHNDTNIVDTKGNANFNTLSVNDKNLSEYIPTFEYDPSTKTLKIKSGQPLPQKITE